MELIQTSWTEFLQPQKVIVAIGVILLLIFIYFAARKIMSSDEDEGKAFNATIYRKRVLLIELGLIVLLIGEVFVGTSLADQDLFWSRLVQLTVVAIFGAIAGISTAPQWKEALDMWLNMEKFKALNSSDRNKANTMLFIQVMGAVVFSSLALLCPFIVLWFVASGLDELDHIWPMYWGEASDALIGTIIFSMLHVFAIVMIGIVSMDKILDINQEELLEKADSKSKRLSLDWANVLQYLKKHMGWEHTATEAMVNSDPGKAIILKRQLTRLVADAIEYGKVINDIDAPDSEALAAESGLKTIHSELASLKPAPAATPVS